MSAPTRGRTAGKPSYRWVYLWHWPIRAMHWAAAVSIAVLVVTGFYIGRPYFAPAPGEAIDHYMMGRMRFLHFAAAGVLVATGIVRVYWLLVAGNRYERLSALFPLSRKRFPEPAAGGAQVPADALGVAAPLPGSQPAPADLLHGVCT